jgi:5-formyltetrahydrofolate cyclo-ligase
MTKAELRKTYLDKRKTLSDAERNEKSLRIADLFFKNFNLESIRFLHVFLSIEKNREIETAFIFKRVWRDFPQITTVVPRVNLQTMTLDNLRFTAETSLVKNRWHIFEPTQNELIEIKLIDACLVPLLCFDRKGFRVGYGKGFYDKLLSLCRADCLKIGLSYFEPVDEIADTNIFDVKLDFCITPTEIMRFKL